MPDEQEPIQVSMQINLQHTEEIGVFADYANIWHTPNTFVLDFLTVKQPPHPPVAPDGEPLPGDHILEARVATRVRIPAEQVFPLIAALQEQGNQWLTEQGRTEPPSNWVGSN